MTPGCHIAVFSKAPVAGQVKTRLIPALGAQGAAQAHRRLLRYTLSIVHGSGYASSIWIAGELDHPDLLGMSEAFGMPLRRQSGSDLGARMKAAMQDLLCTADAAVIIGTDCPVLEPRHLEQIFIALASGHEVAAIPAEDGGYVLIAMSGGEPGRRAQLLDALFDDMPWSTDRVMPLTRERLMAMDATWFEMPPLWDVDYPEDFARLDALAQFPVVHTP